jgi:hypothetical protein
MTDAPGSKIVGRRHPEWREHHLRWQFLLDSWEGGDRYRRAIYGLDSRGLPVRNLIRHKHEYPDPRSRTGSWQQGLQGVPYDEPGSDRAALATDDDYELRRARTPVPTFTREAVETHLAKIFTKEVDRDGPDALVAWWADVDGRGTAADDWFEQEVAPLFMVLGQVDLLFDQPAPPPGEAVASEADVARLGLRRCIASVVMPENLVWWRLDAKGRYAECVVVEYLEDATGSSARCYRHWTAGGSQLYDDKGEPAGPPRPHPYGRAPIVRVFDRRRPRARHVGLSRYEGIAEKQREFYNRDSELVLSDTHQAHCLIQAPEDVFNSDGEMPAGPSFILPKIKNEKGANTAYEGYEVLAFPTAGADSLRLNKQDIREAVDRDAKLTKPAGARGTTGNTVAQSGVSKRLDSQDGLHLLGQITGSLRRLETAAAEMALLVMGSGTIAPADLAAAAVTYPKSFDLLSLDELVQGAEGLQAFLDAAGMAPEVETALACKMVREILPGLEDDDYEAYDAELRVAIAAKAADTSRRREATPMPPAPPGAAGVEGGDAGAAGPP